MPFLLHGNAAPGIAAEGQTGQVLTPLWVIPCENCSDNCALPIIGPTSQHRALLPVAKCGEISVTQRHCHSYHRSPDCLAASAPPALSCLPAASTHPEASSLHPFPSIEVRIRQRRRVADRLITGWLWAGLPFLQSPETVDQQRENSVSNHRRHRSTLSAAILALFAVPFCA